MANDKIYLVKPSNAASSVYFDGTTSGSANVAGSISNGYTFTANSTNDSVTGALIQVGDAYVDHAWKITGSTAIADSIVGGNGADTLFGGADTNADSLVGGAGKDVFLMEGSTSKADVIEDFTYGEDVIYAGSAANYKGATIGTDGTIEISSNKIQVVDTDKDGIYKATVANATSQSNIWFSNGASVYMDASSETSALVLDGVATGADTLVGGSGKDTIWAGANDLVYGGAGADEIKISSSGQANVGVVLTSAGGTDKVANFSFGASTTANDYVDLFENSISDAAISYAKGNVTVSLGSASLVIDDGTDEAYKDVVVRDASGTDYLVAVANSAKGSTIALTGAENYVIGAAGYNTAVQAANGGVTVDLSSKYDANTVYQNITTVVGGTGADTIIGAAATNNSLAGGTGADSIWGGGASNDTLTGGDGADTFWFGLGDGKDVITDYVAGTDSIRLTAAGQVTSATRANTTSADVTITTADGSTLTVKGTSNASDVLTMDLGDGVTAGAEIGKTGAKNIFSSTGANYFYGSTSTDTLKVTNTTAVKNNDIAAVYLDNRLAGTGYYSVENIDASGSTVSVELAGDSASNVITAGTGDASLWGGAGATADTLVGGTTGTNTFYFGTGEGNDTITKSTAADQVMLYDVASTDVKSGVLSSTGVMTITLNDGSTLAIKGYNANSVATFTLTDGTYTYDYTGKEWNFKANS